uniref:ribonuclease P n=1 Tax=Globisporangium ultimum (strain ATCC 200006 / CBS 805.95 / DAOM BR144) TaxID=431595 RepID=K3W671_GLOUD
MKHIARRVCASAARSSRSSGASATTTSTRCNSSFAAAAARSHALPPALRSQRGGPTVLLESRRREWSSSANAAAVASSDTTTDASASRSAARGHWNVHHEIVNKKKGLPEVFERLKEEHQLRTLKANFVRQAVDMFYFHCVQQVATLDESFRVQVLQYFNEELLQATSKNDDDDETDKRFVLGETLNEAVFGAVIKLHLARNETEAAWGVVDKLHEVANAKLHFRTVGSILEHECRNGAFLKAYARWQQLKDGEVGWTKAMEDVLVQMVLACHTSHYHHQATTPEEFNEQMTQLLRDLRLSCKEISHASAQRLRQMFHDSGYTAKVLPSDQAMCPTCFCCGLPLVKKDISDAERQQLLLAIESRESKVMKDGATAKDFLAPFKEWLLAKHKKTEGSDKLHFILDGPNIAYINQNFDAGSCRLDHIDAVAEMLLAEGHQVSITMPFSYLAEKIVLRIRTKKIKQQQKQGKFTTRMRTEEEKALIEKWQEKGMIFSCRTDCISDDLFWLYASVLLGKEGRVVTNDQGRDHVFALLNSKVLKASKPKRGQSSSSSEPNSPPEISMDLIDRWKELTIVNIEIQHEEFLPNDPPQPVGKNGKAAVIPIEEIRLLHPLPFSRVPQVTAPEHFHFPISNDPPSAQPSSATPAANAKNVRKKWLCLHRKPATA